MSVTEEAPFPDHDGMSLRVLASGSSGNCSVLVFSRAGLRRVCLIDLGLSPRRTVRLLAACGLGLHDVDDILLTHLDCDHLYRTWARRLPGHVRVRVHERHARGAAAAGLPAHLLAPFDEPFVMQCDLGGATVSPMVNAHDRLGSVAYRVDMTCADGVATLGFATDLGRVPAGLVEHLRGVEVLAIESNYCPTMQIESDRPVYLKRRIMGGAGHLSNHEAVEAVRAIGPRGHVVLLHLSRQCNHPEIAAALHAGAGYGLTVASQIEPTGWVRIAPGPAAVRPIVHIAQPGLFEPAAAS